MMPYKIQSTSNRDHCYHIMKTLFALVCLLVLVTGNEKGGLCPSTHPYVFAKGTKCCAFKKERRDKNFFGRCDGSVLNFDSSCCAHYAVRKCPKSPCRDFKPCIISRIRPKVPLQRPTYKGSEVVGIASGGSCTGRGNADLSISHAKSLEEKVEISLLDRQDIDWQQSSTLNLVGMPAFWSFGAMIGGAWTWGKGGKRSVSETRTKSSSTTITTSASNTAPFQLPGAGLLTATARKFEINRNDVPVEVTAKCFPNADKAKNCVHGGRYFNGGTIRLAFEHQPTKQLQKCVKLCEAEPECSSVSYVEYNYWGKRKSKCKLKKPGHGERGCDWFTSCTSVKIGQCGSPINVSTERRVETKYHSKMDFKSFSYTAVHFTPINSGRNLKNCNPNFLSCVKHIPDTYNHFFGQVSEVEDRFRKCKSIHRVRNG